MGKYIKILMLLSILLTGCVVEKYTMLEGYLHNQTNHIVTVYFYDNGIISANDSINLKAGDSVLLGSSSHRGEVKGPSFSSDYFSGFTDSAIVVFDNQYKTLHYITTPDSLYKNYYLYTSSRNIFNAQSYELTRVKQKGIYTNYNRYYFTESDYEYAKK
ncbi:MAG: hypothetical protein QM642_10680 [Edaphocola sp.]